MSDDLKRIRMMGNPDIIRQIDEGAMRFIDGTTFVGIEFEDGAKWIIKSTRLRQWLEGEAQR